MRRLVVNVAEQMSLGAAQQGVNIPPEKLYIGVSRFLDDSEMVLCRETVESFHPRDWAILISHANKHSIEPRDLLMEILSTGMASSARIAADMKAKQLAAESRKQAAKKPSLRVVK